MSDTNPQLFSVYALGIDDRDTHVQPGNHLRMVAHPAMGLPVAPFVVQRAVGKSSGLVTRQTAQFFLNDTQPISLPFTIRDGQRVTARIVKTAAERCIWAQVDAEPAGVVPRLPDLEPITDIRGPIRRGAIVRPVPNNGLVNRVGDRIRVVPELRNFRRTPFDRFNRLRRSGLRIEAFMNNGDTGTASIGVRTEPRYAFYGPDIVELQITGAGTINRLIWIEPGDRQKLEFDTVDFVNLPHPGGLRYISVANAIDRAERRVRLQAPKRQPLQDGGSAQPPATQPVVSAMDEVGRVMSLGADLPDQLEKLINDPVAPADQIVTEPVIDQVTNQTLGTIDYSRLNTVLQQQLDPGQASRLGLMWQDDDRSVQGDEFIFYRVLAYYRPSLPTRLPDEPTDPERIMVEAMIQAHLARTQPYRKTGITERLLQYARKIDGLKFNADNAKAFEDSGDIVGMSSIICVDRGAVPAAPTSPVIARTEDKGWIPASPPEAIRDIDLGLNGVATPALLACLRRDPSGSSQITIVNPKNDDGYHLPLLISEGSGSRTPEPGQAALDGYLCDRRAGPDAIDYHIAQQSWFGRWSQWRTATAPPGVRPKPPRPVFTASYIMPALDDAATLPGTVKVRIPVPETLSLAPASHLLASLRLESRRVLDGVVTVHTALASDAAPPVTTTPPIVDPLDVLLVEFSGPVLSAAAEETLALTAQWVNTEGTLSIPSEVLNLDIRDPRPPAQIGLPPELTYTARPDVTGLAWVEHRWSVEPGQDAYGIYYSDENRLVSFLEAHADTALNTLASTISSTSEPDVRASLFRQNQDQFPDHLFERLRDVQLEPDTSGMPGFRHPVSGSLRVLNFYKITAEGRGGNRPPLTDVDMMIFAVPNADPPPQPVLDAQSAAPEPDENDYVAALHVRVPPGTTTAVRWRLRRSRTTSTHIGRMPIVSAGPMPGPDADGLQRVIIRDDGPVEIAAQAKLDPWVQYSYVVDVQGPPERGSGIARQSGGTTPLVEGLWSTVSPAATISLIPASPPDPFLSAQLSSTPQSDGHDNVEISAALVPGTTLSGAEFGAYKVEILRADPTGIIQRLREVDVSGSGPFTLLGYADDPAEIVPVGTQYILRLIDPMGRKSADLSVLLN